MEQLPTSSRFVGIDISKDRLDVHVPPSGRAFAVARNDSPSYSVRPNGAFHQWREDPPRELSVDPGS